MKLSVITDEISADPETAIELAREWGVPAIELRGIGEQRYPDVSDFWKARVPELVRESGLQVAALSPGLFKIPLAMPPAPETRILRWEDAMLFRRYESAEGLVRFHLEELLPQTIAAAQALGSAVIVCFSFDRGPEIPTDATVPEGVVDVLRDAARRVGDAGLTLAVEAEHVCWGDTGARTAALVRRVGHPALGINWDPANAFRAGEDAPFPDGYAALRDLVRHVHYKDAAVNPETGARHFVFDGSVDWVGQIRALEQDGYSGYISVETHVRPKVATARQSIERLRRLIESEAS
ncbi:MAG: sugar phosphate isomerase/epimerase [Chloroflexi bacterium]|nr:sugar phosphate isomerase/epimerase [Chloroflexota bacterium]